jgi:hypothetical protein
MSWLRNWTQTGQTGHEIFSMEVLPSGFVSSSRIVKNLNITSDLETRDCADLKNRKIVDQGWDDGQGHVLCAFPQRAYKGLKGLVKQKGSQRAQRAQR